MKFSTKQIHAGVTPDPLSGSILTPIYQSTTFVQPSVDEYLSKGYSYSRSSNPTVKALEAKLTVLEDGANTSCFSTGMAAIQAVMDLPLRCHPDETQLIEHMQDAQAGYGFPTTPSPVVTADLLDGETIDFAGLKIRVSHVPGHSPGQIMFTLPGYAIVGDCLFAGSVVRPQFLKSS